MVKLKGLQLSTWHIFEFNNEKNYNHWIDFVLEEKEGLFSSPSEIKEDMLGTSKKNIENSFSLYEGWFINKDFNVQYEKLKNQEIKLEEYDGEEFVFNKDKFYIQYQRISYCHLEYEIEDSTLHCEKFKDYFVLTIGGDVFMSGLDCKRDKVKPISCKIINNDGEIIAGQCNLDNYKQIIKPDMPDF